MNKQNEILDKIKNLTPDKEQPDSQTKKYTFTLPVYLMDYVQQLKTVKGYRSNSYTVRMILENYFNGLLNE